MRNTWLFHCLLPLLIACGSQEAPQSQEMQEAVRLFEASHHLYDSLSQLRDEIKQSPTEAQDSLSLAEWQTELTQWHEDMVTAGTHDHDHGDGHDHSHDHHHHHEPELQVTDQQMLEIQQEQWQTIQRLARQLEELR
jgi:hypothetical protein